MLLDLARSAGINPTRVSSSKGGIYHSPCPHPHCGGTDRFTIWAGEDRYRCRRCGAAGDSIEFCRVFLGMTFLEARDRVGKVCASTFTFVKQPSVKAIRFPKQLWVEKAEKFVDSSHHRLLIDPVTLKYIQTSRGLSIETIRQSRIGWNPAWSRQRRSDWGVAEEEGKLWMPLDAGIVIPTFLEGHVSRIAIRRRDWKEGDKYGKYCQLPGNSNMMSLFGFWMNQVAVLVESELDALLLCQEIGEFCSVIAISGAQNKPDPIIAQWLQGRRLILYALDSDGAGQEQYKHWKETFPWLRAWPANSRKSPADSYLQDKVNLKDWFEEGIRFWEKRL